MKEYRLVWCRKPYAYNDQHVLFVEAANPKDAQKIAINYIERHHGIPHSDFGISGSEKIYDAGLGMIEETIPTPTGKVKHEEA